MLADTKSSWTVSSYSESPSVDRRSLREFEQRYWAERCRCLCADAAILFQLKRVSWLRAGPIQLRRSSAPAGAAGVGARPPALEHRAPRRRSIPSDTTPVVPSSLRGIAPPHGDPPSPKMSPGRPPFGRSPGHSREYAPACPTAEGQKGGSLCRCHVRPPEAILVGGRPLAESPPSPRVCSRPAAVRA